jgi:hypothetical protein
MKAVKTTQTTIRLLQPVGSDQSPNRWLYIISYMSFHILSIQNKYQPRAALFAPILALLHVPGSNHCTSREYSLTVCLRFLIIAPVRSVGAANTKQPLLILT